MTEQQQSATLTLCFMAAATDGTNDLEHGEIRRIANRAPSPNIQIDVLYLVGQQKLNDVNNSNLFHSSRSSSAVP